MKIKNKFELLCMEMVLQTKANYSKLLIWQNFGIYQSFIYDKIINMQWEQVEKERQLTQNIIQD